MDIRALILALLLTTPALAQDTPVPRIPLSPEGGPTEDGLGLMQEGAKLLFEGLMQEMAPAIEGMGEALQEMEPAVRDLLALIDDIRNYQAPEMLPNGDIIIRRKPDAPLRPLEDGEIEL
jgi:hypothetical protein